MMASERSTVTETTGPHAPDDPRDPHGIFDDIGGVDAFLDEHDADTLEEALRAAEEKPSSTPRDEMRRCPNESCHSVKVREKKANYSIDHMRPERFRCEECGTHFDEPLPPEVER